MRETKIWKNINVEILLLNLKIKKIKIYNFSTYFLFLFRIFFNLRFSYLLFPFFLIKQGINLNVINYFIH